LAGLRALLEIKEEELATVREELRVMTQAYQESANKLMLLQGTGGSSSFVEAKGLGVMQETSSESSSSNVQQHLDKETPGESSSSIAQAAALEALLEESDAEGAVIHEGQGESSSSMAPATVQEVQGESSTSGSSKTPVDLTITRDSLRSASTRFVGTRGAKGKGKGKGKGKASRP
jgi:hypothetical protein